jgi:hypothetical protein
MQAKRIETGDITPDKAGWQQEISFEQNGRTRREIFVGRHRAELDAAVAELVTEIRKELRKS